MKDTFDRFTPFDRGRFGDNESASSPTREARSNLVDLDLVLHNDHKRKAAIAVSTSGSTEFYDWKWLPRSKIEYEAKGLVGGVNRVKVTLPEWLAKAKGLI